MKVDFNEIIDKVLIKKGNAFFYTPSFYENAESYFFQNFNDQVIIKGSDDYKEKLKEVDEKTSGGLAAYGLMHYEFGYLLEERFNAQSLLGQNEQLATFMFFKTEDVRQIHSSDIHFSTNSCNSYSINNFRILESKHNYFQAINKIKEHIQSGDTYQVNYTVKSEFNLSGSIESLISTLIFNQTARYIAVINDFPKLVISISPELFFEYNGELLTTRPMKGTIKRGVNTEEDSRNRLRLQNSKKDQAENIMIVDLLRNDMGKISEIDSVKVEKKFEIEKYESVYQQTTTIQSSARKLGIMDIIPNIFPCGSVTGAPKIRTMEIIQELENYKRGIYTGAIGMLNSDKMTFNVPIRTLEFDLKKNTGILPIGSGIVWDSDSETEYDEIKLKAAFLSNPTSYFEIIESMLVENGEVFLFDYHLNRIMEAASFFLFKFDTMKFTNIVNNAASDLDPESKYKLRLRLDKWGNMYFDIAEVYDASNDIKLKISSQHVDENNKFQYFKTTNRDLYNQEYQTYNSKGYYDVLFFNTRDELAESSRFNVIVRIGNKLLTPPVAAGILNGCYRQYMLDNGRLIEKTLLREDLIHADEILLCNSVRGLIKVDLVDY